MLFEAGFAATIAGPPGTRATAWRRDFASLNGDAALPRPATSATRSPSNLCNALSEVFCNLRTEVEFGLRGGFLIPSRPPSKST